MSPWVFYVIDVIQTMKAFLWIAVPICTCVFGGYSLAFVEGDSHSTDCTEIKKEWMKITCLLLVLVAMVIFLPSRETIVKMAAAYTNCKEEQIYQVESVAQAVIEKELIRVQQK